jgi:hypothetical protein
MPSGRSMPLVCGISSESEAREKSENGIDAPLQPGRSTSFWKDGRGPKRQAGKLAAIIGGDRRRSVRTGWAESIRR